VSSLLDNKKPVRLVDGCESVANDIVSVMWYLTDETQQ